MSSARDDIAISVAKPAPNSLPKPISTTWALIAINLLVFFSMVVSGGHLLKFGGEQVLRWGGNYGPLTLDGQAWRLISNMFVHIGLLHIAVNLWALYELGMLAEHIFGRTSTLLLYLLTGVAGGIASLARNPTIVSAGASGAIFGLAGALIAALALSRLVVRSRALMVVLASLVAFAGYNLTYGFLKGGIDNGAHLGGLLSGLALGVVLSRGLGEERKPAPSAHFYLFSVTLVVLVVGFAAVKRIRGEAVAIVSAHQALQAGDPDLAIRRLAHVAATHSNAEVFSLLGAAYTEKKQDGMAEGYYHKALHWNANDFSAHSGLGLLLIRSGRLEDGSEQLEQALKSDPKADGVWLELGVVRQKQGRYAESIACLQKAAALNPGSSPAQFALGISEMNLRHYDAAIAAFSKATQLNPNDYKAQVWLANAYEAKGLTAQAEVAYARAQQLRRALPTVPRRR